MIRTLYVLIGADCDPDRPSFGGTGLAQRSQSMIWKGVTEGIVNFLEAREKAKNLSPKITWNIRSDDQIEQVYGRAGWAAAEFFPLWEKLKKLGDEIAWHPHLWRWNEIGGRWFQEVHDPPWMEECLEKGAAGFQEVFGGGPKTVHSGWCFQDNTTMRTLARLGVRVDYSALPGMRSIGVPRKSGSSADNIFDWSVTPSAPYFPSQGDYRIPPAPGRRALPVLEIPEHTVRSLPLWALSLFAEMKKSTWTGRLRLLSRSSFQRSFVPIDMHPRLFSAALDGEFQGDDEKKFFATHLHPDEFLPAGSPLYRIDFLFANLRTLAERTARAGAAIRFVTASEAAEIVIGC